MGLILIKQKIHRETEKHALDQTNEHSDMRTHGYTHTCSDQARCSNSQRQALTNFGSGETFRVFQAFVTSRTADE